MLYFDAHTHIGNQKVKITDENRDLLGYKEYSPSTPENCMRKALANSVCKTAIFPFPLAEHSFELQNNYVLAAAEKYPYFFIPFLIPESIDALEQKKDRFVGIKDHFYFDLKNLGMRDRVDRCATLDFAQETGKLYLFHAHREHWGDRIKQICENFPRLKVIVAHAARSKPFSGVNISNKIDELKNLIPSRLLENFFFETSTVRNSEAVENIVRNFGADHVLWGTDFPYYSMKGENIHSKEIEVIQNARLSENDKELIFSENFRSLFQGNEIWIRQAIADDSVQLLQMLSVISPEEQKFLALSLKRDLIKRLMKTGGHILVAEDRQGKIVGFLRGSDRHNQSLMIEEIYVLPDVRGKKVATKLVKAVMPSYTAVEVKTYASNAGMNAVLKRLGFTPQFSPKRTMILWKK